MTVDGARLFADPALSHVEFSKVAWF